MVRAEKGLQAGNINAYMIPKGIEAIAAIAANPIPCQILFSFIGHLRSFHFFCFGVPFPVWYCDNCEEVILASKDQLPVDPLKDTPPIGECPKCGCKEAYFRTEQTRGADEPETEFYTCVKCEKVWREYD